MVVLNGYTWVRRYSIGDGDNTFTHSQLDVMDG